MKKKDIMNLINSEEGTYRINCLSYLHRWTKTGTGENCDCLELVFDSVNGVRFSIYDTKIKSRNYSGIIQECKTLTQQFLEEVSRSLCSDLSAGYRNKE